MPITVQTCCYNISIISVFTRKKRICVSVSKATRVAVHDKTDAYIHRKLHFLCIRIYFVPTPHD